MPTSAVFTSLEQFHISGRGTVYVVPNQTEQREDVLARQLIGTTVLIDGAERRVIGLESGLVPGHIVKAGDLIGLLVSDVPTS